MAYVFTDIEIYVGFLNMKAPIMWIYVSCYTQMFCKASDDYGLAKKSPRVTIFACYACAICAPTCHAN